MNIVLPPAVRSLPGADPGPAAGSARLHHRFVGQAALTPDAVAVLHGGLRMGYRALDQRSNRIAHVLRDHGVGQGDRVGLCLERGPDLVAAVLAVLKAGAAAVPLDPAYPGERLQLMLDNSRPRVLIGGPVLPGFAGAVLGLDDPSLDDAPATPVPDAGDPSGSAPAFVFYTSGSTGRPKGVVLGHAATRFIDWAERSLGRDALARVAATTSICFDPSIFEILAPLSVGGTVILKRDLLEPFPCGEQPTLLNGVPSAFAELARENRIPGSVRVINVGGERLSASLARMIHLHAADGVQLWNHYGPTETTICASVALVPADVAADPPIGRPIAGAVFHVLDPAGNPVAPGASGELHIGGANVALGYLGQPALTAERFLPDPFLPGGRMYRTGDIVRATGSGDLVFLGREGRQIKLHGFRIELDEVEAAVARLPGIDSAATLATCGPDGLVDGIRAVIASGGDWRLDTLRRSLRDSLPRHMLPNQLIVLPTLPLTPSGKLDRQALQRLAAPAPAALADADPSMPALAEAILAVFRDVLQRPGLGPQDDFFDHGGDSLQAMEALLRIETLLEEPVPGFLLAQEASAASLAAAVSRRLALSQSPADGCRAVRLQADTEGVPLFCLAESADRPLQALPLAYRMRTDRPVWSLVPSRDGSVEDHRAALRARPPGQKLLLLAAGGAAPGAVSLAARLAAEGRQVVLVLVAPVFPPDTRSGLHRLRHRLGRFVPGRDARRGAGRAASGCRTVLLSDGGMSGAVPGWRLPAGTIAFIALPARGDPMREPAVQQLADTLRRCLPSARGAPPSGTRADAVSPIPHPGRAGDPT